MNRWIAATGVAAATALAVFLGAGPASAAAVAPPAPVTMTSSELGGLAGSASTDTAVGALAASGGAAVGTATVVGASTVLGGLAIGTGVGAWIGQWMGGSGDFACDASTLWGSGQLCPTSPDPIYVPNSDVGAVTPGWQGGLSSYTSDYSLTWPWSTKGTTTVGVVVSGGSVASGGPLTVTLQTSGLPTSAYVQVVQKFVSGDGGAGSCGGGSSSGSVHPGNVWNVGTIAAGCAWHVEISATSTSTPVLKFYPVGNPLRPADPDPDPSRTFVTSWLCMDGTTGSQASQPFHETDPEWPGIPTAQCDASALKHVTVAEVTLTGGSRDLWSWDLPAEVQTAIAARPECADGSCELGLYRVDASTGARLDCFSSSSVCATWWTDTAQATTNTDQYQCTYGGVDVALDECTVYAHAFDQGVYADPRTGETTSTTPAPQPEPGQDDNCPPPFSWSALWSQWWAYKATSCALSDAFVPKTALDTASVRTAWNGTALGQVGAPIGAMGASLGGLPDGQCGVVIDAAPDVLGGQELRVSTCDEPFKTSGPILRNIIGIGFGLGAVVIGVRTITRTIRVDVPVDGNGGGQ